MCLQCHQTGDAEEHVRQLKEVVRDPHYNQWNSTTLGHLYISLAGFDGEEGSALANQILQNFIEWGRDNPEYGTNFVLDPIPMKQVEVTRNNVVEFHNRLVAEGRTMEQMREAILHGENLLGDQKQPSSPRSTGHSVTWYSNPGMNVDVVVERLENLLENGDLTTWTDKVTMQMIALKWHRDARVRDVATRLLKKMNKNALCSIM